MICVSATGSDRLRIANVTTIKFFATKSRPALDILTTFRKEVFAFVAIYILEIVFFASCYYTLALSSKHSFSNAGQMTRLDAIYFSVVTISTLGYGDIVPRSQFAKALTTCEILGGIFTIVIYFSFLTIGLTRKIPNRSSGE
jgi:hypothetical protein